MIQPRTLQQDLLAYFATAAPMEGVSQRGSDATAEITLPMFVVHVGSIDEEWEGSGIYRCHVAMQLHTQGEDESGEDAAERLNAVIAAMSDHEAVSAALEAHFAVTAIIEKGFQLVHKDTQMIHAQRYDFLLSANVES
jgi:hypothetical protein